MKDTPEPFLQSVSELTMFSLDRIPAGSLPTFSSIGTFLTALSSLWLWTLTGSSSGGILLEDPSVVPSGGGSSPPVLDESSLESVSVPFWRISSSLDWLSDELEQSSLDVSEEGFRSRTYKQTRQLILCLSYKYTKMHLITFLPCIGHQTRNSFVSRELPSALGAVVHTIRCWSCWDMYILGSHIESCCSNVFTLSSRLEILSTNTSWVQSVLTDSLAVWYTFSKSCWK